MWRAVNPDGTLTYAFVESVKATYPYYTVRLVGGLLYFSGMVMMAWNVWKTVAGRSVVEASIPAAAPAVQSPITPLAASGAAKAGA
jgi:cytochrome c oxidase cbb3-type subunit 1